MKIYAKVRFLLLLLGVIISLSSCACPKNPGPLTSDRPGQTTSPDIVPPCYPQVEMGWTHTENEDDSGTRTKVDQIPNTLLRLGVIPNGEVRVGYVGYNWQDTNLRDGAETGSSGTGDASLAVKYRFLEASGWLPESAFLGQLSIPIGADNFTSHGVDPSFLFAFANPLTDFMTFSYNLGASWQTARNSDTDQDHTLSNFNYTANLGFSLTDHLGAFVEAYGSIAMNPSNSPANSVDGGFTYLILENLQVDISGGKGISDAATDWFVGAGFTYRYPQ